MTGAGPLHFLAKFLLLLRGKARHSGIHFLLPHSLTSRPGSAPVAPTPAAEQNAGKQQQAQRLPERDERTIEQGRHQPVPKIHGQETGRRNEQGTKENKLKAAQQPVGAIHESFYVETPGLIKKDVFLEAGVELRCVLSIGAFRG